MSEQIASITAEQEEALAELSAYIAPASTPPLVLPGNPGEGFPGSPLAGDIASLAGALRGADILSKSPSKSAHIAGAAGASSQTHPSLCATKRFFDLAAAIIALTLLSPVLLICALAIRLNSEGPIFFRQRRAGRGGNSFSFIKFRSMKKDGGPLLAQHLEQNEAAREEWKKSQKLRDDPRVTTVGRFIRRFSLDELPQLWNVITGDMSIVGPRPLELYQIPIYESYADYCTVRPGLTGLWQVSGRNHTSFHERSVLDSHYVRKWSLATDAQIILSTIPVVLRAHGAY